MQFKGNLYLEVKDTTTGKVKKTISVKNTGTFLGNWNPYIDDDFLGILTEPLTETFGDSTTPVDSSTVEGIIAVTYGFEREENLHYSHTSDDKSYLEINISWSPDNPTTIYGLYTRYEGTWFVTSIIQLEDPLTVQPTDTLSGKYRIDFYSDIESRIQIVKGEYGIGVVLPYKARTYRNDVNKNYYEEASELDNWYFWREVNPDLNYKTNQLTRLFKHTTTEAGDWEEDYVVGTINSTGSLELQYDDTTAIDSSSILVEGGYWTLYTKYTQTGGIGTAHYRPYFKVSRWFNTLSNFIFILDKKLKIYRSNGEIWWSNNFGVKIEDIFPSSLSICPYDVDKLLVMYQNKIELINWHQFEKKVAATPPSGNYFKNSTDRYGIFYDMQSHYLFVYSATNKWLLYEEEEDTGTFNFVKEITSMSSGDFPGNISWPYCICYSGKVFNLSTDSFVINGNDNAGPGVSQITINSKMFLKTSGKILIFDKNTETITSASNRDYPTYILSRQAPGFSLLSHYENGWYSQQYYAVATGENSWKFYPTVYWLHWFEFGEAEPFGALDTKVATTEWRTIDGGLRYRHSAGPTEPSFVENEKFSITSSETGLYSDKLQKHSVTWVKIYGSKGVGDRIKGGSDWIVRNYYNNLPEEQKIYYTEDFPENCYIDSTTVLQDIEEADSTSNVYIYIDGYDSRDSYFFASITKDGNKWVTEWHLTPKQSTTVCLGVKWVTNKLIFPFPQKYFADWKPKIYIWKSDKSFIDEVDSIGMCVSDKIYSLWKENIGRPYIILVQNYHCWPFGSPRYIDTKVLINIL